MTPTVYVMATRRRGVLYVGVTSDPIKRVWQHRTDAIDGFTKRYGVHALVYFEVHATMLEAIRREKQIKRWNRGWKIDLIETTNPEWLDLWPVLTRE